MGRDGTGKICAALRSPKPFTCVRVNTLTCSVDDGVLMLRQKLGEKWKVLPHPVLHDALIIDSMPNPDPLPSTTLEVVVNRLCAEAVLKGANVFSVGLRGATQFSAGDYVIISSELHAKKQLARGFRLEKVEVPRIPVAIGVAECSRRDGFRMESGLVIRTVAITIGDGERVLGPPLHDIAMSGSDLYVQQLPSLVVSHVLHPLPGEHILDMCAAPGSKTTHIAALMQGKGSVVACDRRKSKIRRIRRNLKRLDIGIVEAVLCDSASSHRSFPDASFDRVLVDAPCSCSGIRPRIEWPENSPSPSGLPDYQLAILRNAVALLKPGGVLVYSTCSVSPLENEEVVSKALAEHPSLELVPATPIIGSPGISGCGIPDECCAFVQRFNPDDAIGTGGFFIAKFVKQNETKDVTTGLASVRTCAPSVGESRSHAPDTLPLHSTAHDGNYLTPPVIGALLVTAVTVAAYFAIKRTSSH